MRRKERGDKLREEGRGTYLGIGPGTPCSTSSIATTPWAGVRQHPRGTTPPAGDAFESFVSKYQWPL